jgi:hypothetical protein
MPDPSFAITFADHDVPVDSIVRGLDAFKHFLVNLTYRPDVEPYCPNPVYIMGTTDQTALLATEAVDARADGSHKHTIPFEAVTGVEIL